MKYDLSIIVPVYNKYSFTKSCVEDLLYLDINNEIIIVDNASTDETQKELEKITNSNFVYIRNNENYFHSKGCNIGYIASKGDSVLFLNNDIKVRGDRRSWTNLIIKSCNDGIIGPTMGQLDDKLNFVREANMHLHGNSYMSGWCVASSKENWNKLDLGNGQIWNEKYPMYFNDTDLSFRARKLGIPFKVVPVSVAHYGKKSTNPVNIPKLYNAGRKVFISDWEKNNSI